MVTTKTFTYEEILGLRFGYRPLGWRGLVTHIYFVDGLLIDTGQSRARRQILSEIAKLPVEQILLTHHHEDHTGNVTLLREQHQCHVYASEGCCRLMKDPPALSLAQKITWGDRPPVYDLLPLEGTIKTKHFSFELIPVPGHASDMVALYEPDRKWLFSADLYINSYIDFFLRGESIAKQIASIKKILALDFEVLLCGHQPKLTNGKRALAKKLDFLEGFFADVAELHHRGHSTGEIFHILRLKENWFVRLLSGGQLSKLNMVKSVIEDISQ